MHTFVSYHKYSTLSSMLLRISPITYDDLYILPVSKDTNFKFQKFHSFLSFSS